MKVNVHIDFETPRWLGRIVAYAVPMIVLLGAGAWVFASPTKFAPTDRLTAANLQSLNVIDAGVNGSYSVGATRYCGTTQTTTTGQLGGYPGARMLCTSGNVPGCSTTTAHICSGEELVRSAALGMPQLPVEGWYAAGGAEVQINGEEWGGDCSGFTQTTGRGSVWGGSTWGTSPGANVCSQLRAVHCCD